MNNRADCAETRGNSLPYSVSCGLSLMLKITLNYKHGAGGSCSLLRNRPISITYGCMRNHRIGGNAQRDANTCLFSSSF